MANDTYTIQLDGLEKLAKAFKTLPEGRIGILQDSPHGQKGTGKKTPTVGEVGAAHEFGAPARGLPMRSFLRIPLTENLNKYVKKDGLINKADLEEVVKKGSAIPWLKKVMVSAENVVQDAFDSKGFGKWKPWKNPNYENNTGQILVDTQQLRDSITSEVQE